MVHILFHRGTRWKSEVHCSTNIYARQYLKSGYKVSFMQGLSHLSKFFAKKPYYEVTPFFDEEAWVFSPFSLVPPKVDHLFPTIGPRLSYTFCVPSIKTLLAESNYGEPDIIWTTRPGSSVLRTLFPHSLIIFQVVDYYPAFGTKATKSMEKRDYEVADHIFSIGYALTDYLEKELAIRSEKITTLGQGVYLERYQGSASEPEDIRELPHPRGVLVGVLDKADKELMNIAAEELAKAGGSLILIGTDSDWVRRCSQQYSNVYFLGSRSPLHVPDYLRHCDIGLMLYNRAQAEVYRGQNPLKLYEYAAAGLAIISTPHHEYAYMNVPTIVVNSSDEVRNAINAALSNRKAMGSLALEFVKGKSWYSKFEQSEELIKILLKRSLR